MTPSEDGIYPVSVCYEEDEGAFPSACEWKNGEWHNPRKNTYQEIGLVNKRVSEWVNVKCADFEEARKLALSLGLGW